MATRRNIVPPNLLVAPKDYSPQYQELLNNSQRLFYSTVANRINSPVPYGSFLTNTTNLTNPVANAVNLVPFAVTTEAFGVTLGSVSSRIYFTETAVYNIQFSAQVNKTSGGAASIYFWFRKNGTNIASSTGKVVVPSPNSELLPAWNIVLTIQDGDYIELAWSSSDTNMILEYEAATNGRPAIPAVILTATWVSGVNLSAGLS